MNVILPGLLLSIGESVDRVSVYERVGLGDHSSCSGTQQGGQLSSCFSCIFENGSKIRGQRAIDTYAACYALVRTATTLLKKWVLADGTRRCHPRVGTCLGLTAPEGRKAQGKSLSTGSGIHYHLPRQYEFVTQITRF